MFNVINESCPYQNWTSVAMERCPNSDHFHCLKDEYGRIGWVCSEPVWVEKDRCPVFNVGAKKLDTTSCFQTRCPPYNYPSNDIDVEYACRYIMNRKSPTTPFTTKTTDTNKHNNWIIVALTMLTFATIAVFVAGILFYKSRRQPQRNYVKRDEESIDLMQQTAIEKSKQVQRPTGMFDKAKSFLIQKKMVVITGVQGSGKTFLAKSLVKDLQKDGKLMDSSLICSIHELQWGTGKEIDIYIIDELFYELQLNENFKKTLLALNEFLRNAGETYCIITIPSFTWKNHLDEFDASFYKVHVNLDEREDIEKAMILKSLKAQYSVSSEQTEKLNELDNDLLVTSLDCIGFPAFVSWMYKQPSVEKSKKCLNYPLQMMSEEISSIKKAKTVEERGKFLALSYICLKQGRSDVKKVDKKLFDSLKERYAPEFEDEDLSKYCREMVGYYLWCDENGFFEFDLNIMKKIVFVCLAKDSPEFVKEHCKHDYFKYLIDKEDSCPRLVDKWFTECFTIAKETYLINPLKTVL